MEKIKVIMDVDTGTDDAVALCMAMLADEFDLLGITAVNGNVEVRCTTDNSLRVVECCDSQGKVNVYKGADLPLVCTLNPHSPQSLEPIPFREGMNKEYVMHNFHLPLPEPTIHESEKCATVFLIETLLACKDHEVVLCPVGPMTNIALALRSCPDIVKKIKKIVLMGGGHDIVNTTSAAEFNIFADPEAMEILLQSGIDITFVPLDATHHALINETQAKEILAIGTKPAKLIHDVVMERIEHYVARDRDMKELRATPVHDALAIMAVAHPEVLRDVRECHCDIDISNGTGSGRTIFDLRDRNVPVPPNCKVALSADNEMFVNWVKDVLVKDAERK